MCCSTAATTRFVLALRAAAVSQCCFFQVLIDLGSAAPLRLEVKSRKEALTVQDEAAIHTTAPFRPPELLDVKSECVIDGSADVFMLGATLFAMAFGRSPFESETGQTFTLAIMVRNLCSARRQLISL